MVSILADPANAPPTLLSVLPAHHLTTKVIFDSHNTADFKYIWVCLSEGLHAIPSTFYTVYAHIYFVFHSKNACNITSMFNEHVLAYLALKTTVCADMMMIILIKTFSYIFFAGPHVKKFFSRVQWPTLSDNLSVSWFSTVIPMYNDPSSPTLVLWLPFQVFMCSDPPFLVLPLYTYLFVSWHLHAV